MAKRYSAEVAVELIMNENSEMDSADSFDEEFTSDAESTSESEIESESEESDFTGRKILQNIAPQTHRGGRIRTRGGAFNIRGRGRSVRTRGCLQTAAHRSKIRIRNIEDSEDSATELSSREENENEEEEISRGGDSAIRNDLNDGKGPVKAPGGDDPLLFFNLFINDELLQEIVDRSNAYADRVINSSRPLRRNSILKTWNNVTLEEMRQFLGLIFHIGLVAMPSYRCYCSTDRLYKNELFKSKMSRNRFQSIMRFLNFGEEPSFQNDRLSKVRFLLNHHNSTVADVYTPEKELSLDESMMLWRGRLVFRQYIKNKRHKYGVNFFELCTNDGFVLKAEIYSGVKFADTEALGQRGTFVFHIMNPYLYKGYHVFTDNWYNSVPLTKYMTQRKTYISGTLRADKKHLPEEVTKKKLKKGEMNFRSSDDISVTKWKDKRDVRMISNAFIPELVETVNRHGKSRQKPNIVDIYNHNMSGIDRSDQMLSYHSGLRKTIRWYKKVGVHILEIFMENAFYLYKKATPSPKVKAMKGFKDTIITSMVGQPKPSKHMQPQASFHYLAAIEPTEKKKHPARTCKHCSSNGKRRETRYICPGCPQQPALCIDPCFRIHHQNIGVVGFDDAKSSSEEE
ncbi:piggyBac transposable element-derived protein 4-like [Hydractinia symbiolongicarpus]|uniref:piggyBac transposable element-derived protein 4-like n=1 Tax=Hydractinia symbiolongicarpus TaxID=13093 RepID=UPI002550D4ED|nr:piggyBac transposable element-derived protein 4-like [Hydractinia symbiolongicarpus]